ncbi:MAG: hypothetical protein ACI9T8_000080 [Candidatus Saccharimonadales bacterium]|jgi:hypothetical protein
MVNADNDHVNSAAVEEAKPKKKMSVAVKIVLAVVGGFVLLVGGGAFLTYNSTKEAAEQSRQFVNALAAGDLDTAYSYFSTNLVEQQSKEVFTGSFSNSPFNDTCHFVTSGVRTESGSNGSARTIDGRIECDNGNYASKFVYIDQDGEEKIVSYKINPVGVPFPSDDDSSGTDSDEDSDSDESDSGVDSEGDSN